MTWLDALGIDTAYALQILKIIGIDIVLAGDNAVVIAMACRMLPPRQRMMGILLGAGVAILLRVVFTLVVQQLLDVPLLKLLGGFLLVWIALKLVTANDPEDHNVKSGTSLWEAVRIIAIADIVMSLDNVLAIAAAAHGDPLLIVFGLALSVPLVVGGATLITSLLVRFPILIWGGAALLGWVAGELIATEPLLASAMHTVGETLGLTAKGVARVFEVLGVIVVVSIGLAIRRSADAAHTDSTT
ncbi:TerC family protein [Hyphomicrobium sp.]|uniref:TerC family protein n=1 Tax=Hyphomicrobium sp. TaxID=82 RepID=UPI002B544EA4|nr:TerC family protein [Hyphomicrobium sp.]HRN89041.1 TerC family protein [Hyphomicrobium sp.]HRQ28138.1 TerC family protein [Hyphomicrobium sp.]